MRKPVSDASSSFPSVCLLLSCLLHSSSESLIFTPDHVICLYHRTSLSSFWASSLCLPFLRPCCTAGVYTSGFYHGCCCSGFPSISPTGQLPPLSFPFSFSVWTLRLWAVCFFHSVFVTLCQSVSQLSKTSMRTSHVAHVFQNHLSSHLTALSCSSRCYHPFLSGVLFYNFLFVTFFPPFSPISWEECSCLFHFTVPTGEKDRKSDGRMTNPCSVQGDTHWLSSPTPCATGEHTRTHFPGDYRLREQDDTHANVAGRLRRLCLQRAPGKKSGHLTNIQDN